MNFEMNKACKNAKQYKNNEYRYVFQKILHVYMYFEKIFYWEELKKIFWKLKFKKNFEKKLKN